MTKKTDTKKTQKTVTRIKQSLPTFRSVEVQTNNEPPIRTTMNIEGQHINLVAPPNSSPYVHFVNVPYPMQSAQFSSEGPPETSIIQDDITHLNDYNQPPASIRSMPNIALTQGKKFQIIIIIKKEKRMFPLKSYGYRKSHAYEFITSFSCFESDYLD